MVARRAVPIIAVALAAGLAATGGCGSGVDRSDATADVSLASVSSRPGDFSLTLTVYGAESATRAAVAGAQGRAAGGNPPLWARSGRYVVEADGVLRVALGPGLDEQTFPARTRWLTDAEFDALFALVRDRGLLRGDHPSRARSLANWSPPEGSTSFVLSWMAGGVRRTLALEGSDSDARRVADHLARLAWQR